MTPETPRVRDASCCKRGCDEIVSVRALSATPGETPRVMCKLAFHLQPFPRRADSPGSLNLTASGPPSSPHPLRQIAKPCLERGKAWLLGNRWKAGNSTVAPPSSRLSNELERENMPYSSTVLFFPILFSETRQSDRFQAGLTSWHCGSCIELVWYILVHAKAIQIIILSSPVALTGQPCYQLGQSSVHWIHVD